MESLETLFATAFSYLQTLAKPSGPFVNVSRRLVLVDTVDPSQLPGLYQHQLSSGALAQSFEGLVGITGRAHWYIYASAPDMKVATTPILNPLVDTVLAAFPQIGSVIQVESGGHAVTLTLDGEIEYYEGLLDTKSVARIPVKMVLVK